MKMDRRAREELVVHFFLPHLADAAVFSSYLLMKALQPGARRLLLPRT